METNETLKRILLNQAEACIERMLTNIAEGTEGDFQQMEQSMQVESREFGRSCLEAVLEETAKKQGAAARRKGKCGHHQRLVGSRPRQILTVLGRIRVHRAYYQCRRDKEEEAKGEPMICTHGEAPFDQQWGWSRQRSSPGVQKAVSYLAAQMTLEGVAQAVRRLWSIELSARQVLNLIQPIGEAFLRQENEDVQEVFKQGASQHSSETDRQSGQAKPIKRLYVETDGVFARLRRDSVVMEQDEQEREGDVSRDIKVGAVFLGQPGRERSSLAPMCLLIQRVPSSMSPGARVSMLSRLCSTPWLKRKASRERNTSWCWGMERTGSGASLRNSFPVRCRLWMNIMHVSMSGRSPALPLLLKPPKKNSGRPM
jgi:hypothetical protein